MCAAATGRTGMNSAPVIAPITIVSFIRIIVSVRVIAFYICKVEKNFIVSRAIVTNAPPHHENIAMLHSEWVSR